MPDMTPDELRAAQHAEYSRFVAVQAIDIGTARAFNVGDAVPASTVESGAVPRDAVRGVNTKAAAAAVDTQKEG